MIAFGVGDLESELIQFLKGDMKMRQHIAELPPLGTIPGRNNNELKCTLLFS